MDCELVIFQMTDELPERTFGTRAISEPSLGKPCCLGGHHTYLVYAGQEGVESDTGDEVSSSPLPEKKSTEELVHEGWVFDEVLSVRQTDSPHRVGLHPASSFACDVVSFLCKCDHAFQRIFFESFCDHAEIAGFPIFLEEEDSEAGSVFPFDE